MPSFMSHVVSGEAQCKNDLVISVTYEPLSPMSVHLRGIPRCQRSKPSEGGWRCFWKILWGERVLDSWHFFESWQIAMRIAPPTGHLSSAGCHHQLNPNGHTSTINCMGTTCTTKGQMDENLKLPQLKSPWLTSPNSRLNFTDKNPSIGSKR